MDNYDIILCCGGKCGSVTLLSTFVNNDFETLHTHGTFENENIDSFGTLISIQKNIKFLFLIRTEHQ